MDLLENFTWSRGMKDWSDNMIQRKVTITKREAATCQLETAIKLFLENRDLISAYTLCCAADGILEGIYSNERDEILKKQLHQSMTPDRLRFSWAEEMEVRIKPEHQKAVFRLLTAAQNFFKHADKDHDSSYQFPDWELTGVRLAMTVINYNLVFREITPAINLYFTLYAILKPDLLAEGNPLLDVMAAMPDIKAMSEGLLREDIATIGYSALKSACPGLFKQPSAVGCLSSPP